MAQSLPVDEVHMLSTYVESILYGILFVMYLACVWVLVKRRNPSRGINNAMLLITTAMMVIATLFEAVSIERDVGAFFQHKDLSAVDYYDLSSIWANLYQSALWNAQLLIGDSLLVYRMYVVYGRRLWVVALPILLLIGSAVCGANVIYQFSLVDASDDPHFLPKDVAPWTTSVIAVTMSQTAISTIAIALRLWWAGRNIGRWFSGKYWGAITVFLESGLPFTLTLITLTILHFRDPNIHHFAYYGIVPVTGISFTGLIIRVCLREYTGINSVPPSAEPTYPHKIRSHGLPGTMTFAPPPTQTQGTILSTLTDSSIAQAFTTSGSTPDLEKAMPPPLRSSHSGFSLSATPQRGEESQYDMHLHIYDRHAKSAEELH